MASLTSHSSKLIAANTSFAVVDNYDALFREALPFNFSNVPMRKLPPTLVPVEALTPKGAESEEPAADAVARRKRISPMKLTSAIDEAMKDGLAPLPYEEPSEHDFVAEGKAKTRAAAALKRKRNAPVAPVMESGSDSADEESVVDSEDDAMDVDVDEDEDEGEGEGEGAANENADPDDGDADDDDFELQGSDAASASAASSDEDDGDVLLAASGSRGARSLHDSAGAAAAANEAVLLTEDDIAVLNKRHANNVAPLHVTELPEALFSHPSTIAGVISRLAPALSTKSIPNENAIQRAVHTLATVYSIAATGDVVSARHLRSIRDEFKMPPGSTHDLREKVDKLTTATTELYALTMHPSMQARMTSLLNKA